MSAVPANMYTSPCVVVVVRISCCTGSLIARSGWSRGCNILQYYGVAGRVSPHPSRPRSHLRARCRPHAPEPASVLTFLGDRAGDAPRDATGAPRFAFSHRLGLGTDLGALAPGESIRERLALQVPYDLPVGRWTLWVGIARGAGFVPMVDGSAVSARASLDVSLGERELWVLPRVHR